MQPESRLGIRKDWEKLMNLEGSSQFHGTTAELRPQYRLSGRFLPARSSSAWMEHDFRDHG
jgi:hypothetical protein